MSGIRFGGLISGLDTDSVVKALTMNQQAKIDNIKKENQISTWKQNDYRTIISKLNDFRTKYFSNSNPLTNLLSSSAINGYTSKATNFFGAISNAVDAKATGTINSKEHSLAVISLAQKDVYRSDAVSSMKSNAAVNFAGIAAGDKLTANLDGQLKTITLDGGYANINALKDDLQNKLNSAFGTGKITAGSDGVALNFTSVGHNFGLGDASGTNFTDTLKKLGFQNADGTGKVTYTALQLNTALKDTNFANTLNFVGGEAKFVINDQTFTVSENDTLQSVMDKVNNNSAANVRMYYSDLNGSISIEGKATGTASAISMRDTSGNLLGAIFTGGSALVSESTIALSMRSQKAQDAEFILDGIRTSRATNSFTADGITYNLNQVTVADPLSVRADEYVKINMEADTSKTKELLLNFAKDYNELIKFINDKTREERNKTYSPLTADQRSSMTENDIKLWEEEAKKGHLRNDDILINLLNNFSNAMFGSRTATGGNAFGLGFGNTSSYNDGGQIAVDTAQLDRILSMAPDEVEKLFNDPTNGIATKLDKMVGYFAGTKLEETGLLTKRAGVAGGFSDYFNSISDDIRNRNTRIEEMLVSLNKKQNDLYSQYAKLESTMSKLNGQLNSMMSKLG